jgi:MoaA/NifB/PqqE/SkfB family radical SAM enzyme
MRLVTAYLYVTFRCNSRCKFCDIWRKQPKSSIDLSIDLGIKLLDDLRRLGVRHVDFTGGEPTLYPDLPKLALHARNLGIITSVTTNGMLYQKRASELSGLLDSLAFSLNGPNAQVHDELHGVACFDKTLASIQLARSMGEPVHAHFTATDSSIAYLDDTLALARSLDVPLLIFPEFSYFGNQPLAQKHLDKLFDTANKPGACVNLASIMLQRSGGNSRSQPVCYAGYSALAIAPDGNLMLPCFHSCQSRIPTNGDLYATYLREDVQRILQESGRYRFCEGCTNWCYINPSFIYRPSRYTLPYIASALRSVREVYQRNWLKKAVATAFPALWIRRSQLRTR